MMNNEITKDLEEAPNLPYFIAATKAWEEVYSARVKHSAAVYITK